MDKLGRHGRNRENHKKHFILDGFVTDFVELTQDLSKSWKHLAEFDTNLERRCKMHKRRIDMNTHLIKGTRKRHKYSQKRASIDHFRNKSTILSCCMSTNSI